MSTRHVALRDLGGVQITVLTWAPFFLNICDTVTSKPGVGSCGTQPPMSAQDGLGLPVLSRGPLIAPTSLPGSPHPSC